MLNIDVMKLQLRSRTFAAVNLHDLVLKDLAKLCDYSRGHIRSEKMKKFFMSMVAAIVCGTAFAGNVNEVATSAVSDEALSSSTPDKTVSTFYGSKASSNANNPCKGATIRKCGTIESSLVSFEDQTLVMQQEKDVEGNTLSVNNFFVPSSVSETKANIKVETMKLGGTFKENVVE